MDKEENSNSERLKVLFNRFAKLFSCFNRAFGRLLINERNSLVISRLTVVFKVRENLAKAPVDLPGFYKQETEQHDHSLMTLRLLPFYKQGCLRQMERGIVGARHGIIVVLAL